MKPKWFVLHTLSGQELNVKKSIEKRMKAEEMNDYILEVLVPEEKVVEVRGGKKKTTRRKLHPGYVYINMILLDDENRLLEKPWYFIRETPGVIGFIGGDRPVPVPESDIEEIKARITEAEESEKPKVEHYVGETVKINDGPFLNFSGVIEEVDHERGKLKVTVNIFGRSTPVELEYWQVEKA